MKGQATESQMVFDQSNYESLSEETQDSCPTEGKVKKINK